MSARKCQHEARGAFKGTCLLVEVMGDRQCLGPFTTGEGAPGEKTPGVEAAVIAARRGRKGTVEMLQSTWSIPAQAAPNCCW
ncbi:MAG TPA: hypothetical protein VK134_06375 [Ktedonobacteraceae bacterium]|nr:hypothetical protein [Ktedonobacteraceae bacterium]